MTREQQPWWRFIAAAAFDLALVVAPTAAVAAGLAEHFVFLETDSSPDWFSPADQARINEIDETINRGLHFGGELHTLSGTGLWLTVAVMVIASAVVFVLIPALFDKLTPGQYLMGIQLSGDPEGIVERASQADPVGECPRFVEPEKLFKPKELEPYMLTAESEAALAQHRVFATASSKNRSPKGGPVREPADELTIEIEVDVTDAGPTPPTRAGRSQFGQIILADADDYLRWDREQDRDGKASGTTLVRSAPVRSSKTKPEWSSDWNAWMYCDEANKRWYRHDTEADRWLPIT